MMYAFGFILGMILLPRLCKMTKLSLSEKQRESLIFLIFLGVLLGGRIGFVLFYGGEYFIENPLKILAVWEGGMSSHGGFIGVALTITYFVRRTHTNFFRLTDTIIIPVALGLAFGRLGNFINGELYGTVTSLPWGMHFPNVDGLRHPTQMYAMFKDLTIAACSLLALKKYYRSGQEKTGIPTAIFLMMYAAFRFTVEIYRDQPYGYTQILGSDFSRGQLLTIPILLIGITLFVVKKQKKVF